MHLANLALIPLGRRPFGNLDGALLTIVASFGVGRGFPYGFKWKSPLKSLYPLSIISHGMTYQVAANP
jgi:hypothetical protein